LYFRSFFTTRKDNVSRFEEETNAVLAEISQVRESVNKHLDEIEDKLLKSSGVNDTDICFKSRKNLEMSSSMRGIFSRSSSRLTRHCISDPCDKQASNMSLNA
jgi:hypothetical protein